MDFRFKQIIQKAKMNLELDYMEIIQRKETLCPELKKHLRKLPSFHALQHPLVYSVPYNESLNALLNIQLVQRREETKRLLDTKDYEGYVFLHEKPHRLDAFNRVDFLLTDKIYWKLLSEIWTNSENIWQQKQLWKSFLESKRKDRVLMMDKSELKVYNNLPDQVTVYRGCTEGLNEKGFSYTIDITKAEWFAKRWESKGNGKVIKRIVNRDKIIAYLDGRNEKEVIIIN